MAKKSTPKKKREPMVKVTSRRERELKTEIEEAKSVLKKVKKKGLTESIVRQEGRVVGLTKEKEKAQKTTAGIRKAKAKIERLGSGLSKVKILKKPTAKGIAPVSARKTLKGFAHSAGPMVREVPQVEVVQDNRSQFFNDELEKEERSVNKWLS